MKKAMYFMALTMMAAMVAACGSKQQSAESQEADSLTVENIVEEEPISPDYVMLNLKGKVKSYEINGFCWKVLGSKVEFDEAGQVVKIDGKKPNLTRNDKGQIVKYNYKEADEFGDLYDCSMEYQYGENDQLVKIKTSNMYDDWDSEFERDDEGNIVTWKNLSAAEGVIASKYKYQTFDEQGNWTKLSEGSEVSSRKLTYWE